MLVFDSISNDFKTVYYTNITDQIIPLKIEVYECSTNTLIFTNEIDAHPHIQYYTYMPQAWKNRKVLIYNKKNNNLILPLWIDGMVNISEVDKFGYIKKLFEIEKNPDSQLAIHATLSEHFMDKKYGSYVDVGEGDVVIDIGFNYGVFALRSLYKGASKIFGFEPNLNVFEVCEKVYTDKNKVEIFNFAIGGKNEIKKFQIGQSSLTSSTYGEVEDFVTSYDVYSVSIVDFLFFNGVEKIDFLKVDCEGSEYEIFESIPDSIFLQIKKIHVEFHYNDGLKVKSIIDKLNRNGFEWKFDGDSNEKSVIGMIYAKQKK
jgi:FkbM family methyltransferase